MVPKYPGETKLLHTILSSPGAGLWPSTEMFPLFPKPRLTGGAQDIAADWTPGKEFTRSRSSVKN